MSDTSSPARTSRRLFILLGKEENGAALIEIAKKRRAIGWNTGREWLHDTTGRYLAGTHEAPALFEALQRIFQEDGFMDYDPASFSEVPLPDSVRILLAQFYGTFEGFRQHVQSGSGAISREGYYAAWKMGLISSEKLWSIPPRAYKKKLMREAPKPPWKRKKK